MQDFEVLDLPLTGRGHVGDSLNAGDVRYFLPGDYEKLENVVITPEGTIKNRLPAHGLMHEASKKLSKIIGSWGPNVMYTAYDLGASLSRLYVSYNNRYIQEATWTNELAFRTNIEVASAFPVGTKQILFEGVVQYGDDAYMIVVHCNQTAGGASHTYTAKFYAVKIIDYSNALANEALTVFELDSTLANLVPFRTEVITHNAVAFPAIPQVPVVNQFIFKDRLFVACGDTVYFSRATDVIKFSTANDGGFFTFPGKTIKDVLALGDIVYVIFENSVSTITYNTSPNTDARVQSISEGIGGKSACTYGNTIYLLDHFSIYAIVGTSLSKVMDLSVPLTTSILATKAASFDNLSAGSVPNLKIAAYADGLYIFMRNLVFGNIIGDIHSVRYYGAPEIYRVDLLDGHTSRFTFGNVGMQQPRIADMKVVSFGYGIEQSSRLFMLGAPRTNSETSHFGLFLSLHDGLYFGAGPQDVIPYADYALDSISVLGGNALEVGPIAMSIQIKSISPDSLGLLQKKWRTLHFQANWPSATDGPDVMDDQTFVALMQLRMTAHHKLPVGVRPPQQPFTSADTVAMDVVLDEHVFANTNADQLTGYTYGINQRAPSLELSLFTTNVFNKIKNWIEFANEGGQPYLEASKLEIANIRLMYTYLKRSTGAGRAVGFNR